MHDHMDPKITVIICTYRREELLAGALNSLLNQSLSPEKFAVIVLDNGSSNETKKLVEKFQVSDCSISYAAESRTGLGFARNAGAALAKTEYLAFLDDDALADRYWLERIISCFISVIPTPAAVGGPVLPFYNTPKPAWFRDEYEIRTLGGHPHFLAPGESFVGSNMAFQRQAILTAGGFNVKVGMAGKRLSLGEETGLFLKMWQIFGKGLTLYYCPDAIVHHLVPENKMKVSYRLKRSFISGKVWSVQEGPKTVTKKIAWLLGTPPEFIRLLLKSLSGLPRYTFRQRWLVENFSPIAARLGSACGLLSRSE